MRLLPTDPAQRRRLIFMTILLALMAGAYWKWGMSEPPPIPKTTGPAPTSNPSVAIRGTAKGKKVEPSGPQALRLASMEDVPDEPQPGRNPFRFGTRPAPPPPPPPPYVAPVYTPPPAPTPPPIPPVPLFLVFILPAGQQGPKAVAYLHDKSGNAFQGVEGDTIDGRYILLRVGETNVVMTHLNGTGQTVLRPGG